MIGRISVLPSDLFVLRIILLVLGIVVRGEDDIEREVDRESSWKRARHIA